MNVRIDSSRIIKPFYEGPPPPTTNYVPLSVFDKVTYNTHIAILYAYHLPTPPNATIENGLKMALSEYREWAGRLGQNNKGDSVIFLNDKGVRFVEASVDSKLDQAILLHPSPALLSLHPSLKGVEELLQVQLTRFSCGSLVVGFTTQHVVADGDSVSNFLVAWGKVCRGQGMIKPLPTHDRTIFIPRDPPRFVFDHRGVEFTSKNLMQNHDPTYTDADKDVVIHKVHFSFDFLAMLKARASRKINKPYSTFESLLAHLWRVITKARGLCGMETTNIRISVNGRKRLNTVPNEYFGNLVLWAFPSAKVDDLLCHPLPYAAKLIHDAVANVNNNYFRSFVDFATHKVEEEGLVPTADINKSVLCPNLDVDSWLRFPFNELDFGCGGPYLFMPSYFLMEGNIFLLPSIKRDGSINAFIQLFEDKVEIFKQICYTLD
ncbi:Transferase domain-containing protein [Cephalotus follicularis]|uniref:Transferase domain-containing protein n=1 Tax=Cephalotus follicularis TaxID=3775 RepID=A0A1Q3AXK7_CEPFO|nr:Transferase domain-containing protein [Cephalotus follicularis]